MRLGNYSKTLNKFPIFKHIFPIYSSKKIQITTKFLYELQHSIK